MFYWLITFSGTHDKLTQVFFIIEIIGNTNRNSIFGYALNYLLFLSLAAMSSHFTKPALEDNETSDLEKTLYNLEGYEFRNNLTFFNQSNKLFSSIRKLIRKII